MITCSLHYALWLTWNCRSHPLWAGCSGHQELGQPLRSVFPVSPPQSQTPAGAVPGHFSFPPAPASCPLSPAASCPPGDWLHGSLRPSPASDAPRSRSSHQAVESQSQGPGPVCRPGRGRSPWSSRRQRKGSLPQCKYFVMKRQWKIKCFLNFLYFSYFLQNICPAWPGGGRRRWWRRWRASWWHSDTGMGVWDALCRGMGHNDIYTRLSRPSSGCVLVRSNCGGDIWRESS